MSTLYPGTTGSRRPPAGTRLKKPKAKRKRAKKRRAASETMSIPEAGAKYYGLSKNGSYAAAARNEIPTVKIGKLRRVPTRLMERILDEAAHDAV
jgi:hypothetical protein